MKQAEKDFKKFKCYAKKKKQKYEDAKKVGKDKMFDKMEQGTPEQINKNAQAAWNTA